MLLGISPTIIVLIAVGVVLLILIAIVVWYISTMNQLRKLEIKIDESLSGIDVALTKRFDALTKMLDATKEYMKYENSTLEKIVKLRQNIIDNKDLDKRNELNDSLNELAKSINVTFEQYPQLKADHVYEKLQAAIMDTEEHLQASRRAYNANVTVLNSKVVSFPASIVAKRIHVEQKEMFKAEEAKKQDVKIQF